MVSTFGEYSGEIAKGSAVSAAKMHAYWALNNHLDGLDADFEEGDMFTKGTGAKWLIDYTIAVRMILPKPCYILSHAP